MKDIDNYQRHSRASNGPTGTRQMAWKRPPRRVAIVAVIANVALLVTLARLALACLFVLSHGATWWL